MTLFANRLLLPLLMVLLLAGCDSLLGAKEDATTEEILEEGKNPGLIEEAEYVPLQPFLTTGGDGQPLQAPHDVYVGFDQFIYVVDDRGIHVLDRAGRPALLLTEIGWSDDDAQSLSSATSVTQDQRLDVYVTARRDTVLEDGTPWNLPVIYRISGLTVGTPQLEDIIWHPFDDPSRMRISAYAMPNDATFMDTEVEFTGVALLPDNAIYPDNSVYVSRRGPVNDPPIASLFPQNRVLVYGPTGAFLEDAPLNPTQPGLRSAIYPSDVLTTVQPVPEPQRANYGSNLSFMLAQTSAPSNPDPLRYGVVSVRVNETVQGLEYTSDISLLTVVGDTTQGENFLYDEFVFENPVDLGYAADGTGYLFVLDAYDEELDLGTDSVFVFTQRGVEGVAPPPGAVQRSRPVPVSFGGTGDGARQFRSPGGIAYFDQVVYVADTGNNRISRFRLNTDFE